MSLRLCAGTDVNVNHACLHHVRAMVKLSDDESQLCLLTHHVRLLIILTSPFAVLSHVELMSALVLYIRWVEQTAVSERLVVAVDLTAPSDRQFVGVLGVGGVAGVFANHEAFHAEA